MTNSSNYIIIDQSEYAIHGYGPTVEEPSAVTDPLSLFSGGGAVAANATEARTPTAAMAPTAANALRRRPVKSFM